jgi:hypothetical protein
MSVSSYGLDLKLLPHHLVFRGILVESYLALEHIVSGFHN